MGRISVSALGIVKPNSRVSLLLCGPILRLILPWVPNGIGSLGELAQLENCSEDAL